MLRRGLRSLYNNDEERVKAAVEGIKQAYDSSQMVNFYPSVAMIVREVRKRVIFMAIILMRQSIMKKTDLNRTVKMPYICLTKIMESRKF